MIPRTDIPLAWTLLVLLAGIVAGVQCALYLFDVYDDGVAEPFSGLLGLVFVAIALGLALWPYRDDGSTGAQ